MKGSSVHDIVIIGGGIIGMATAMSILQNKNVSLTVIEAENRLAAHQTGNNSGVIHSGLYYAPGSLKARNCTYGRDQLYRFCKKNDIPVEQCGKIVVATEQSELPRLYNLEERGIKNGLEGIKRINSEEIKEYEPHATGIAGLYVPQTGIVDYTMVTEKFGEMVREKNGEIKLEHRVIDIQKRSDEIIIETDNGEILCRNLINCAGLQSDRIAKKSGVNPGLKIIPFRGEYYELKSHKKNLVNNLIYPVPDPEFPFLGVHFTRMINGGIEAGPNAVLAFKREGYKKTSFSLRDFAETMLYKGSIILFSKHWRMGMGEMYRSWNKTAFVRALNRIIPVLTGEDIIPGGAGVRAQALEPNGFLVDDFRIIETDRIINVLNTPSPAATASISIGQTIAEMALKNFNTL